MHHQPNQSERARTSLFHQFPFVHHSAFTCARAPRYESWFKIIFADDFASKDEENEMAFCAVAVSAQCGDIGHSFLLQVIRYSLPFHSRCHAVVCWLCIFDALPRIAFFSLAVNYWMSVCSFAESQMRHNGAIAFMIQFQTIL